MQHSILEVSDGHLSAMCADVHLSDIQSGIPSSLKYCSLRDMHHFCNTFSAPHVNVGVPFDNSLTV